MTYVLIYLDSNILIYLVEQSPPFGARATGRISALRAAGDSFVVSDLTRLECRSNAVAAADQITLGVYDAFFDEDAAQIVQLSTAVVVRATMIRGKYRFRTADAVHLAAAVEAGCQSFLTNDLRLKRFPDLVVELLP